ncbi:C-C motif chemokine 7-like [Syngnathus typhle]|uniref:C-C motif chemokine 7-like n=1 Tax=Syngnathus typhle TaxID=161592 RepID=UPI002A6A1077|nr:C-C motif chemokine 7-like [Syngnathus typhle]
MKTLGLFVLLTLFCMATGMVAQGIMFKTGCCSKSVRVLIPKERVKHVATTSDHCHRKAIVVTTVCDKRFCLEGRWDWAEELLRHFETVSANKTSVPAPFNQTSCEKYIQLT